jgi:TPR repeat protein
MTIESLPKSSDSTAHSCGRCGSSVADLPPMAAYCPHCGGSLVARPMTRLVLMREAMKHLAAVLRRQHPIDRSKSHPGRSNILFGYGNALFNLGWRYERGWGAQRNLPEAIRCYFKSARLGNLDAAIRLAPAKEAMKEESTGPMVPQRAMPIWSDYVDIEPRVENSADEFYRGLSER